MNIVTDKPLWFLFFCLALGAGYAVVLYYKDSKQDFSKTLLYFLSAFRFLAVSLIAFMLLSPLLKTLVKNTEKPVIIIAQDQSESILVNKDSNFYNADYPQKIRTLLEKLSKEYQISEYSFGDKVEEGISFSFSDKSTDMAALVEDINSRYANRNVGALVIASDGLYNKGINPVYAAEKISFPIYCIALGDTTPQKDLLIAKINYNRTAILGNKFPFEILVKATQLNGSNCVLEVTKENQILFSKNIRISGDRYLETVTLTLDAKQSGMQRYRVQLSQIEGEISYTNNIQDIFINVLEGKEKILILTAAPHPDVAALKDGIESNANYEVTVATAGDFTGIVKSFNLIILNQLPSIRYPVVQLIDQANQAGIPLLYCVGASTNLSMFNNLKAGVTILQDKSTFTECQPALNNDFVLFTLSDETRRLINELPPLSCPFGSYKVQNAANILFYQKIGNLTTDRPLLLFGQEPGRKFGLITGEGIWKWRLATFARKNKHDAYNELITKTIQFLSVRLSRDILQVRCNYQFFENEQLVFTAEVHNPSFELINEPDVDIIITDEQNKTFPFSFSKSGYAYQLNAGYFPAGIYRYQAQTRLGEKIYRVNGEFTIVPVQLETLTTTADHSLLFNLASQHNGSMVAASELEKLADLLKKREDIKSITYTQKKYTDWINLPWIFLLILLLLSAEWFLRKRAGSY